ncbi:MAG: RelA/SpoT family protein [Bacteroidota bacterium]
MLTTKDRLSFGDRRKIYKRYINLLNISKVLLNEEDAKIIRDALDEALSYYRDEKLPSGESFVIHLLDVARIIVEEIGLATKSVLAVILYDLVRKEKITLIHVEKKYGKKVSEIIGGLVKVFELKTNEETYEPENFRRLLLTISSDVRVILIRIAILLDEMRRMNYMPKEYQVKTSMQTFLLYAPLAHRLGLYSIKSELEDLSMKYTESQTYRDIIKKLKNTTARRNRYIRKFIEPLKKQLDEQGFDYEIKGRTKSVFSIWKKMKKQNVPFEQVYDIFAIRIILDSNPKYEKSDCWRVFSVVTDVYRPNPERLRDWISIPKSNGYESLHTTVVGPEGKWVEVQIRSRRMDEIAEKGYAAHWKYKGIKGDQAFDNWIGKIRNVLEDGETTANDLIDNFRIDLDSKEIFVFTPKGDLLKLPEGSTVLDFAFDIHSEVGSKCTGAVINNRNVSIKHHLKNGDRIEVITSKNQKPKTDWLNSVVTSKAKAKIRQSLKEEQKKEAETGKELLKRRLKNWKIPYSQEIINQLLKYYNIKEATDFYAYLGNEEIDIGDVKEVIQELNKEQNEKELPEKDEKTKDSKEETAAEQKAIDASKDYIVIGEELKGIDYKLAKCCNPIYGDDIVGYITKNEGVKIHRASCKNAQQLISNHNYRVIDVKWRKTREKQAFQTRIKVSGIDEMGMINKISDIISNNMKVKMRSVSFDSDNGIFEGYINLFVESTKRLDALIRRLKKEKGILKVTRTDMKE